MSDTILVRDVQPFRAILHDIVEREDHQLTELFSVSELYSILGGSRDQALAAALLGMTANTTQHRTQLLMSLFWLCSVYWEGTLDRAASAFLIYYSIVGDLEYLACMMEGTEIGDF